MHITYLYTEINKFLLIGLEIFGLEIIGLDMIGVERIVNHCFHLLKTGVIILIEKCFLGLFFTCSNFWGYFFT